jgi:uncharacterized protein (TIGR00290 family)
MYHIEATFASVNRKKAIFNWSGGKDSSLCLYKILQENNFEIIRLLTSVNSEYQRISMHGVRVELLEKQAGLIGIPLQKLELPEMPDMEIYERQMEKIMAELKAEGAEASIYGDIFLDDLRKYREEKLASIGLTGVFPLWKKDTKELLNEFLDLGFKTIITCVNEKYLDKSYAGKIIDHDFISNLPANVDPCGENGEFHTFVFEGPIFKEPIKIKTGEIIYRKYSPPGGADHPSQNDPYKYGFWYCDLLFDQ